jgi:Zn-dependent peptidase ImmA (M78 family)
MGTVRVGGHRYSDPDVISLVYATGELVDPRSSVLTQARQVNALYRQFESIADPLERIKIIASLLRIKVLPMNIEQQRGEKRDAVLINTADGKQILFNPKRPKERIAFSIAHEISHTFFPNSVCGARFRNIHASSSKEANELERLCDLGAAEILMPIEEFQIATNGNYTLRNVPQMAAMFGSSLEATTYRLATANPEKAVAGLLKFRMTVDEERKAARDAKQIGLFQGPDSPTRDLPKPKYRRQSVHLAEQCDDS